MINKILFLALFLFILNNKSYSQNINSGNSLFLGRSFYKPFVSEISSTLSQVSLGSAQVIFPGGKKNNDIFSEIHLGADIPAYLSKKKSFSYAISFPVSFHMVWSPLEETTAPIINNDYRFGISFMGLKYLDNPFIRNISFKLTPFAHESTHLGDELTIYGIQSIQGFYRVNVSYEYYELGLTLNDPDTITTNLWSVRFGLMGLLNPKKGYYSFFPNEIGNKTVYPSKRWAEYYIDINYNKTSGFLTTKNWHPSFSVEFRNRVLYEYEKEEKSRRLWTINAYIGYDYSPDKKNGAKSVGHYFRFYNGINPHGQLRNMMYRFMGYALVLYY